MIVPINNSKNIDIEKKYKIIQDDVLSVLKNMEDNTIDLIIADPPYFQIKGDFDFVWETKEEYLKWVKEWLIESKRVLKKNGTLMLWGGVGSKPLTFARVAIMIEDEKIFKIQNWITQRNSRGYGTKKITCQLEKTFFFSRRLINILLTYHTQMKNQQEKI